MLPLYDWAKTRAFSLPTDQYGWIRINLAGREAKGIVPVNEYEETCEQLKTLLLGLVDNDRQPLVRDIVSTAGNAEQAITNPLPDLVVHWEDAAFAWPLKITGSQVQAEPVAQKSTGQHASEGFCIYSAADNNSLAGFVEAKDLWRLITRGLS
jgi:predicted AlkP superfamily phosphohydrolase/phosphomutase